MSQNIYIRPGGWVKNSLAAVKGSLDLRKFVRDILVTFNAPAYDPFAPTASVGAPVRYNTETSMLEYFDAGTKAWVQVPAAGLAV